MNKSLVSLLCIGVMLMLCCAEKQDASGKVEGSVGSGGIEKAKRLADQGYELLKEGDYDAALDIAAQLEDLRYSASFEIGAQAHAGLGEKEKAVQLLERGVDEAPSVWLNWHLLANYRSDLGRYDEANEAYRRALQCEGVSRDFVHVNQAIMLSRQGDYAQALDRLELVEDPDLRLRVAATKMTALDGMGRSADALALAESCLSREPEDDDDAEQLADIAASYGRMRLSRGTDKAQVRSDAMAALGRFRFSRDLLALVRDIDGQYSAESQYLRVLVRATLPQNHELRREAQGYFITYDVVAESPHEALGFVREFENAEFPAVELSIEESEQIEDRPEDPKGVYHFTGRSFHEHEDGE